MQSSITLRKHIVRCLQLQLMNETERIQRSNAAFQLAVCYCIGFGGTIEDDGNVTEWLGIAEKPLDELQLEIELLRTRDIDRENEYKNEELVRLAGGGFFTWLFDSHQERSDVHEKELSLSRELEKMQQVLIASDYVISELQRDLANALQDQGYYSRARSMLWPRLQFLETHQKYGPRHPRTIFVALDVLVILGLEGDYAKGIEVGERYLSICHEKFGGEDILTASFQTQLAIVLKGQGRYQSSEALYRQGLETLSQWLGKRHPATLDVMKEIGDLVRLLLRHEEALEIMTEVLERSVETFGMEHPLALDAIGSNGSLLLNMNSHWQAEKLLSMQAAGYRDIWGEDDVRLAPVMNNLALAVVAQNRYAEAAQLSREAVARGVRFLGNDHYKTLQIRSNLAFILSEQAEYAEAETVLRELIPRQESQLGAFHSSTLISKARLALAVRNLGRLEETKSFLSDILNSSKDSTTTVIDHSYRLLKLQIYLARTLQMMDASEASLQEIRTVLEGQAAALEASHADAYAVLTILPCLLEQDGFLPEAEKYHAAAALECKATLGESHIETLTARYWLATYGMLLGRFSDADAFLQQVSSGITEAHGEGHWITQRVQLLVTHWTNYKESKLREADEEAPDDDGEARSDDEDPSNNDEPPT